MALKALAETTIQLDDAEVEVLVEVSFSPGSRGNYTGLPEDCYPDEPPEIDEVKITAADGLVLPYDKLPDAAKKIVDDAAEQAVCEYDDTPDFDD